jgi:hypothetical protein
MRIPLERFHRISSGGVILCLALAAVLAATTPAHAQYVQIQSFEVTPFIGARLGGTFDIQPDGAAQIEATLKDATLRVLRRRWFRRFLTRRVPVDAGSVGVAIRRTVRLPRGIPRRGHAEPVSRGLTRE